ncbi:MAG: sigma-54 dependent transcriptional regulator [Planctomycetota bacterium]
MTQSPQIKDLIGFARRAARSNAPILLTGESGTGKELFAELIHQSSRRREQTFVAVNCAALPENLLESEWFGHEKGAFSGAVATRKGRFEQASGGSLFLDEVSEIPIAAQAKLLRVLETNTFERVGSSDSLHHDVRIIAASNRKLLEEVEASRFRLDLLHRINVIQIEIPPLRNRVGDIPLLAMHFVEEYRGESEDGVEGFESEAMRALARYEWPGNVRELRNVIHRACVLADGKTIGIDQLGLPEPSKATGSSGVETPREENQQALNQGLPEHWLHTHLDEIERQIIVAAIKRFGNRRIVAEKLGVSPRTLTNKIRRYRSLEDAA